MRFRLWRLGAVLLGWMLLGVPAWAQTKYALLVGVSELSAQSKELWLRAPRNDVQAMRNMLVARGFLQENVRVLADGVSQSEDPTASAIRSAMAQLAAKVQRGDFVMLYFSGHGAQVIGRPKRYREPDRLSEIFLARDTLGWDRQSRDVPGSIADDEFDSAIDLILAKGAFIWAIYDTCSAASLTRGKNDGIDTPDDYVRYRGADVRQLKAVQGTMPRTVQQNVLQPRQRYVAFYAAESHQYAPEMKLPRGSLTGRAHGLLTWSLLTALEGTRGTYRDLFQSMLRLYQPVVVELNRRFPTREAPSPVVEGLLDSPLFESVQGPIVRPPTFFVDQSQKDFRIQGGILDGLVPMMPIRIEKESGAAWAEGVLTEVGLNSATVEIKPRGTVPDSEESLTASPQRLPSEYALKVFVDGSVDAGNWRALDLDGTFPAGVQMVEGSSAELLLKPAGVGEWRLEGARPTPLPPRWIEWVKQATEGRAVGAETASRLVRAAAQLKWFSLLSQNSLLGESNVSTGGSPVEVRLVLRGDKSQSVFDLRRDVWKGWTKNGTCSLEIENRSRHSVDLIATVFGPQGEADVIYPSELGDANRLEAANDAPVRLQVPLPANYCKSVPAKHTYLVVVASPARPQSPPRMFGLAESLRAESRQAGLLRGAGGGAAGAKSSALVLLVDLMGAQNIQTQRSGVKDASR